MHYSAEVVLEEWDARSASENYGRLSIRNVISALRHVFRTRPCHARCGEDLLSLSACSSSKTPFWLGTPSYIRETFGYARVYVDYHITTMGIKGLTALLAEHAPKAFQVRTTISLPLKYAHAMSMQEHEIKTLFGRKVAIDASMSIYQFLIAVRQKDGELLTNDAGETTR